MTWQLVSLELRNLVGYYVSSIYVPTLLLLVICYLTFFFDLADFSVTDEVKSQVGQIIRLTDEVKRQVGQIIRLTDEVKRTGETYYQLSDEEKRQVGQIISLTDEVKRQVRHIISLSDEEKRQVGQIISLTDEVKRQVRHIISLSDGVKRQVEQIKKQVNKCKTCKNTPHPTSMKAGPISAILRGKVGGITFSNADSPAGSRRYKVYLVTFYLHNFDNSYANDLSVNVSNIAIFNKTCHNDLQYMDFSEYEYNYRKETWITITWREVIKVSLELRNLVGYYVSSIYVPTLLLLVICYLTFFFDLADFSQEKEIIRLTGEVKRQVGKIISLIDEIKRQVVQIIRLTDEVKSQVGQIIRLTDEVKRQVGQIIRLTDEVKRQVRHIISLSDEEKRQVGQIISLTDEVKRQVRHIISLSDEEKRQVGQIISLTDEVKRQVRHIISLSDGVKRQVEQIKKQVNKCKTCKVSNGK
ncbi:uncharacterized protein [Procambarus clarkii]|uniref:uncharacterized protein n=1 Tax=Procambarus clarkii TaxID=6728 RepID=UPI0037447C01